MIRATGDRAPHLFAFGFGYTANALAAHLIGEGWRVSGTCRESARADALRARGVTAHIFDRDHPLVDVSSALAGVTHVLSSVPPDDAGDAVLDCHARDLAACRALEWVGYLSTTGVYGDRGGGWVDESDARNPSGVRGRRRAAAEDGWLALHRDRGVPVHVFRLAGIYGPERNALVQLRAGTARRIDKPGQVFSRIHVDDIVAVLRASMARPAPGAVYNVADDLAAPPQDVVSFAADLLGVAPPPLVPFAQAELSPMARSFYDDSKRVSNDRIKRELGVTLAYPDYRAGLRALLATER